MHLQQTRIDTLANNLANVATTGFRQVLNAVSERMPARAGAPGMAGEADGPLGVGRAAVGDPMARPLATTLAMTNVVDHRPGPLESTGRGTDVALTGPGFFVVQDTEGNEYFTRDGSFRLDGEGRLMTGGGLAVQGDGGAILAAGGRISVDQDGTVTVDGANRGRLRVVTFERPEDLEHHGNGLLRVTGTDEPVAAPAGTVTVMQGYLEGSNVDPVRTLVDMIAAQRAFEVESKVLQANDEMLGKSVNTLGRNT
jgi:flagellar basal-body rod protein FlgG